MLRTFLRWFVVTVVCAVGVPLVSGVTILASLLFLPLPATLPNPKPGLVSLPSTVYDADGNVIGTFQQFDQSAPVQEKDIPQILKDALVASEDKNFYHEGGVDPRGTLRAFVRDLQGQGYLQGGSTITQQYVDLAYTGQQRTLTRKLRQAILASQLARKLPKDEILYRYLNAVYLGDGCYGVGAASESYFHKPVQDLNVGEAALLVGLIPAPSRYEPRGNQILAEDRRQTVLLKMYEQHYITLTQYQYWKAAQVYESTAPKLPAGAPETLVYAAQQQAAQYPYFVDYVRRYLELQPSIGPDLLYGGGLKIQTTLDPKLQAEAQASVNTTLDGTQEPLEMALVSIEPQTGHVRALIGGRDFSQDQTNLALGGCETPPAGVTVLVTATCQQSAVPEGGGTGRQPGSSFKPFVLATAFEHGVQPTEVIDGPPSIALPKGCTGSACTVIHNAEAAEGGVYTIAQAMWFSVNTVYAQLILDPRVTVEATAETAKALGISSAWYSPQVHGASYALGSLDVSPLDMASAYGVFDNHGVRVPPTPIIRVENASGKTILDDSRPAGTPVLSPIVADNVTNVLTGVISQPGATAYGTGNIGRPAAGKTGTTSSYVDAWFVGYTPTLVTSVWMGKKNTEDPAKGASLDEVCSAGRQQCVSPVFGGTLPAETWADFMQKAMQGVPATNFNQPAPLQTVGNALPATPGAILPGAPQYPTVIGDGGPYVVNPGVPVVVAPTTTTTTSTPLSTSTTTMPLRPGPTTTSPSVTLPQVPP